MWQTQYLEGFQVKPAQNGWPKFTAETNDISLLTPFQLFPPPLSSSHFLSVLRIFPILVNSSQILSTRSNPSQLFSPLLNSSQFLSPLLKLCQLVSPLFAFSQSFLSFVTSSFFSPLINSSELHDFNIVCNQKLQRQNRITAPKQKSTILIIVERNCRRKMSNPKKTEKK